MKKILSVFLTVAIICSMFCINVEVSADSSNGFADTLFMTDFENVSDDFVGTEILLSGTDPYHSLKVVDDPFDSNNKVLCLQNTTSGSPVYSEITFGNDNVLKHISNQDKVSVSMKFDFMTDDEKGTIYRHFFGDPNELDGGDKYGLFDYNGTIYRSYGTSSGDRSAVLSGKTPCVWYECVVTYVFTANPTKPYVCAMVRKKGDAKYSFATYNIMNGNTSASMTELNLLGVHMPKQDTTGKLMTVYLDNIELWSTQTYDMTNFVGGRFRNSEGEIIDSLKNGETISAEIDCVLDHNKNFKRYRPILALYDEDSSELIGVSAYTAGNGAEYATSTYPSVQTTVAGYVKVPESGNYKASLLVWEVDIADKILTTIPLTEKISINTVKNQDNNGEDVVIPEEDGEDVVIPEDTGRSLILLDREKVSQNRINYSSANTCHDMIIAQADEYLNVPTLTKTSSLLEPARNMKRYMEYLGYAYNTTYKNKYFYKAIEQMTAVASFNDWNPTHFLDTAEMTYAMAIGYNWFYDRMTESQRIMVRDSIISNGLSIAYEEYTSDVDAMTWDTRRNNWAQVCHGSMIVGALAVRDDYQNADAIINKAVQGLKDYGIPRYREDGSYFEGPTYWNYSTEFLFQAIAALESVLGDDMGLLDYTSVQNTGKFGVMLNGPAGTFNFNDSGDEIVAPEMLGYMADKFNQPELFDFRRKSGKIPHPYDMIWYSETEAAMPKSAVYTGEHIFVAGSSDNIVGNVGMWTAIKGQNATYDRMDLDCGSFMLDAGGVRWAIDVGVTPYNSSGYWDCTTNGTRWQYYKKRAEAHNTFVINPDANADQSSFDNDSSKNTVAEIEKSSIGDNPYAIINMKNAYDDVYSAKRGIKLYDNGTKVIVQDEIKGDVSGISSFEYYWFMNTDAIISISTDGKTATLTKNGKTLIAKLISEDSNLIFSQMDSTPLNSATIADNSLQNIKKLTVHGTSVKDVNMGIVFTLSPNEITETTLTGLSNW